VSLVYPLSRGVAPVLVLAVGVLALGAEVSALQAVGVAVIAVGVVAVRGLGGAASARDTGLALACGACIAGYTLTDSRGLRHAAPVPYLECVLVLTVAVYLPLLARRRGARAIAGAAAPPIAVAALCIFGAYALVLAALRLAPAAPVAALRETSVVFATAYAALVLGEPAGRRRLAGATAVVTGIAVLALA
jgi:drug/metabolite transporter (DMT)-like permease